MKHKFEPDDRGLFICMFCTIQYGDPLDELDCPGTPASDTVTNPMKDVPEVTEDFLADVLSEGNHQGRRWGEEHDDRKTDDNWFWTLGKIAGKALHPGTTLDKKRHRIRAAAAMLMNWDRAIMRKEALKVEPPQGPRPKPNLKPDGSMAFDPNDDSHIPPWQTHP